MATQELLNLSQFVFSRLHAVSPVETLKLQKLLYYCNAWSLALRDIPMFEDPIQAWKHGPVVASLYPYHRRLAVIDEWPHGDSNQLSEADKEFANQIISLYGGRSGWALRELTHRESPWIEAWHESQNGQVLGYEISHEAMSDYYRQELAKAKSKTSD